MYGQPFMSGAVRGGRSVSSHRGNRPTRSGQTIVYPVCATELEALQCVLFVHDNATRILGSRGDGASPIVYVSCADTLRDIMAGNGSGRGVFAPDTRAKCASGSKAFLPGFCISLRRDHHFTTAAGVHHTETAGAYQAQFHWHEGEGRLTLDPVSKRTADSSARRSVSHPFAYHGLPYLLEPVFRAWQEGRPRGATTPGRTGPAGGLSLQDCHPVIQAQFLGVQFTEAGDWSPAWNDSKAAPRSPLPKHPAMANRSSSPSRPRALFVTPPRGNGKGPTGQHPHTQGSHFTPPATVTWNAYDADTNDAYNKGYCDGTGISPAASSWDTPPRPGARRGSGRGGSRWSPPRPKQVHWGTGTTRALPHTEGEPSRHRGSWGPPAGDPTSSAHPGHAIDGDTVAMLQKLTSFMALRDPDLLAAAAAAVGAESLLPHIHAPKPSAGVGYAHGPPLSGNEPQLHNREQAVTPAEERLRQQEEELAILQREALNTRRLIHEAKCQAEVDAANAVASTARVAAEALRAAEAARQEEARQQLKQQQQQAAAEALRAAEAARQEEARQQLMQQQLRQQQQQAAAEALRAAEAARQEEARQQLRQQQLRRQQQQAAAEALRAAEAAKLEDARQASIREEAARASEIAAESARVAAAQALAEARELEHRLAVQTATALKVEQDKAIARAQAVRASEEELAAREQVLAAAREQNAMLAAELAHTRQVAQQTADIETARASAVVQAAAKKVAEAAASKAREEDDYLNLQAELSKAQQRLAEFGTPGAASPSIPDSTAPTWTANTTFEGGHSGHPRSLGSSTSSRGRDVTPRRRSEEPSRPRLSRSPLGMGHYTDARAKEVRRSKRHDDEAARRETARADAMHQRREKSPIFPPDLYALLGAEDAARATMGLPAHTMESFLLYLHQQVTIPQAAHQNAAPQDPMENDLQSAPSRSQGAPSEGHCQEGGH